MNWFLSIFYRKVFTILDYYKSYKSKEVFLYGKELVTITNINLDEKKNHVTAFIHLDNCDQIILIGTK